MAVADLIYSIIVFVNYLIICNNPMLDLDHLSWITCHFTEFIVNSLDTFCVFLTLLLSVDRLYAIMNPIKSKIFFTNRHPKLIALIGYLVLLVIRSPEFYLNHREYKTIYNNVTLPLSNNNNESSVKFEIKVTNE